MHQVLPPDIIMEILIRTEIESLPRLRWVCKEWRHLLAHPHFINRHHQKSKNVCGYISDDTSVDKHEACLSYDIYFVPHPRLPLSDPLPSLTFMLEPVQIKASTPHGLLLCFGLFNECYYVCKPTTQEWATIPTPPSQTRTVRMVMSVASSNPLRFRIMRFSGNRKNPEIKCEVFDSDSFGMWKTVEGVGPLLCGYRFPGTYIFHGVMVDGSFFWLAHSGIYVATKIMCIDLWEEDGKTLKLPEEVVLDDASFDSYKTLSNLNGELALVRRHRGKVIYDIWRLSSIVEQKWEKKQVIDMNGDHIWAVVRFGWMMTDYIVENMILMNPKRSQKDIFWYNFREDKYIDTNTKYFNELELYFFQSDFFPCNINECRFNNVMS